MFAHIKDVLCGKTTLLVRRSPKWRKVRNDFIIAHPECAVCKSTVKLEVHHIIPFHVERERELDPTNLITLCESKHPWNCHLRFGHKGNYKLYNKNCVADCARARSVLNCFPLWKSISWLKRLGKVVGTKNGNKF